MRHNDYPATLLMEPAANDEPARYRMTPAASTVRYHDAPLSEAFSAERRAYRAACREFERGNRFPGVSGVPGAVAFVAYTRTGARIDTVFTSTVPEPLNPHQIIADCTPVSCAALIGTKTEPEAEVWHTEAPTVAGVYEASSNRLRGAFRHWDGFRWSRMWEDGADTRTIVERKMSQAIPRKMEWLRLIEADTPAPAAQESAKPTFAVGCRIVILPHPEGGKHPSPFLSLMNGAIGKSGTVRHITESGNVDVCLDDRRMFIFPPSSLAIIQA